MSIRVFCTIDIFHEAHHHSAHPTAWPLVKKVVSVPVDNQYDADDVRGQLVIYHFSFMTNTPTFMMHANP